MSRRAKKQQTDRGPLSGTRISNERGRQRKQQRRRSKAVLAVVPSQASNSAPSASVAPVAASSAESVLVPAPAASRLLVANPAADCPLGDGTLADVELSFFQGESLPVAVASDVGVEASPLVADEVDSVRLTPEQQQRRQWFRRHVTALMAGLSAFGTAAVVLRIASLL